MTADELKNLPKGDFVVMKTDVHPMRTHLKLFSEWGIDFDAEHPYTVQEHGNRTVQYADKQELMDAILAQYPPPEMEAEEFSVGSGGMDFPQQTETYMDLPKREPERRTKVKEFAPKTRRGERGNSGRTEVKQNES